MKPRSFPMALAAALVLAAAPVAIAQTSTSFKLEEHVINAGGHPEQGSILFSASYRITLDAIGDNVLGMALGSASFQMDGTFVGVYPPPGEVTGLVFANSSTLSWSPEKSVGVYNVYRDDMSAIPGSFGTCLQPGVGSTSWSDATEPVVAGECWFYLLTAENRLGEEGTRGYRSDGTERGSAGACP